MASKSKAQRAFLIKVVADSDFAKSRKMNQDVARGILDEDEEHIAKDKHWADKLPDRAGGHSMESRDVWYDPEFIPLIVEQQVHPSFESMTEKFKSAFRSLTGGKSSPSASKPAEEKTNYDMLFSHSPASSRKPKEGTADFSALATKLRMKPIQGPFWNGLIKNLDEYVRTVQKIDKDVVDYCNKCKKVYLKCETMQPQAARAYAEAEMRTVNQHVPNKPALPMADFEVMTDKYDYSTSKMLPGSPQQVMCEYPTQAQLDKLISLTSRLYMGVDNDDGYWTLDDTDEIKWWDHHFPGQSSAWGPMINLFPFAGDVRGYSGHGMQQSAHAVTVGMIHLIEAVSVLKAE